tara:strand:+ start:346 stop:600 length:255 start_codon:yes stop_codon:yes gene_type:complete
MNLCQTTLINTSHDNEHVFDVIDMAVAKLMALVEVRHKIVLDEFVLSEILFDSIPGDMHWTELPKYHAGEIYRLCYQELVPYLQ